MPNRLVCWFSCGVTSAVAAKVALGNPPDGREVHIVYCDTGSEHPDNHRFLRDCERWYDHEIEIIRSDRYADTWDVFEKTRYLAGVQGARCTAELKKIPRKQYQLPDDLHVFGLDAGEQKRADRFIDANHDIEIWLP